MYTTKKYKLGYNLGINMMPSGPVSLVRRPNSKNYSHSFEVNREGVPCAGHEYSGLDKTSQEFQKTFLIFSM